MRPGQRPCGRILYASVTLFALEAALFRRSGRPGISGVTRRHHQFLALLILIGAPLLVSLVTQAIPGLHPAAGIQTDAPASDATEDERAAPGDEFHSPSTPMPHGQPQDTAFMATPTLDTAGADPAAQALDPAMTEPSLDTAPMLVLPGDDGAEPSDF